MALAWMGKYTVCTAEACETARCFCWLLTLARSSAARFVTVFLIPSCASGPNECEITDFPALAVSCGGDPVATKCACPARSTASRRRECATLPGAVARLGAPS